MRAARDGANVALIAKTRGAQSAAGLFVDHT